MRNYAGYNSADDSLVFIFLGFLGLIIWLAAGIIAFVEISPVINEAIDSGFVSFLLTLIVAIVVAKISLLLYGLFLVIIAAILQFIVGE